MEELDYFVRGPMGKDLDHCKEDLGTGTGNKIAELRKGY